MAARDGKRMDPGPQKVRKTRYLTYVSALLGREGGDLIDNLSPVKKQDKKIQKRKKKKKEEEEVMIDSQGQLRSHAHCTGHARMYVCVSGCTPA